MKNVVWCAVVVVVVCGGCSSLGISYHPSPEVRKESRVGSFLEEEETFARLDLSFTDVDDPYMLPVGVSTSWSAGLVGEEGRIVVSVTLLTKEELYDGKFRCVPFWIFAARRGRYDVEETVSVSFGGDWRSSMSLEAEGAGFDLVYVEGRLEGVIRILADEE